MSGRFILNTEIINDLISTDTLKLIEKYQRGSGKNHFFTPTISLKLYNPKVTWVDSNKKNLSFSFKKYDNLNLYTMLKNINNSLTYFYKNKAYNPVDNISSFFYEKGDYFYIKAYLPNMNGKYLVNSYFNTTEEAFKIPRVGIIYDTIILDIRNIWEKESHAGFNLELKETYINIE
jgi:hypothetical protein